MIIWTWLDRHAQFLGGGLGQFGARALAHLDLAGEHGDGAVVADVDARGRRPGAAAATAASPATVLRQRRAAADRDHQPRAQHLHEAAPVHREVELHAVGGFLGFQRHDLVRLKDSVFMGSPLGLRHRAAARL